MKLQFTKSALREEEAKLKQLEKYLPTLKLKKLLLQGEIDASIARLETLQKEFLEARSRADEESLLLADKYVDSLLPFLEVQHVKKRYENIAGLEVPLFDQVIFKEASYTLFDTPIWFDELSVILKKAIIARQKIVVEEEKKRALIRELKEVSIRMNLFEKVLIPKSCQIIKKIKIFLNDTQLATLAQVKVAKEKILEKQRLYADWS